MFSNIYTFQVNKKPRKEEPEGARSSLSRRRILKTLELPPWQKAAAILFCALHERIFENYRHYYLSTVILSLIIQLAKATRLL